MELQQIGVREMATLLIGLLIGTSLLLPMGIQARQDAWLAVLLGGGVGILLTWIHASLGQRFPGKSPIAYGRALLGRWLGALVGVLYIWYAFHLGAMVLRIFGEFLLTTILVGTPIIVPMLGLMAVCAYAVRHGLEVMGRASTFLAVLVAIQIFVTAGLVAPEAELRLLLPVLENGIGPVLLGALSVLGVPFGEAVLFLFIYPHVKPVRQVRKRMIWAMVIGTLLLAVAIFRNMMVLGPHLATTERFFSLGAVQEINLGDFLTRLDAVLVTNWAATGFIKTAICLYIASAGTAELVGLEDYRPLTFPIGVMMVALAILVADNVSEMTAFKTEIWPLYTLPFFTIIPLLLLAVARLRQGPAPKQPQQ